MGNITVLLIEDDPMVREVNRQFIEKVKGYTVVGFASNGVEGISQIEKLKPNLVFMDIYMPEQDGLLTIEKIRGKKLPVDVITVTAANDMKTVQHVLQYGVFDYIMKPFTFERVKQSLDRYSDYKQRMDSEDGFTQKELDHIFHSQQSNEKEHPNDCLPKGLNPATLDKIVSYISSQTNPISAEEVSKGVGLARVTARRYLDYLEKQNKVEIIIQYGGIGRPVNQYVVVEE
ncbi:response regulator [Bacillus massiliigorillae]|uniref:response regulator n=1 Tax=Bacillus massiliigorillae TaxID=1243664 RepID=UPI0003A404AA|nr:response regulator [Bacillus massiliigorillae]